jgi:uncharacterized protein YuzE
MFKTARVPLICTYDSDVDATYIYLDHPIEPGHAQRTRTFDTPIGMFNLDLDLDADGHVLGLEILGGTHLPPALLAAILAADSIEPDDK